MNRPSAPAPYRVGIDIGGTFTDVVLLDSATQELHFGKVSTTPRDPADGFFNGLAKIVRQSERPRDRAEGIVHGSTIATNAVLERRGSRMGLLVTAGFRDMFEIGRAYIPGIFTNPVSWQKPDRLVPLELVREIPERLAADGSVVRALDEGVARERIRELSEQGVAAIAISLLHSYMNPAHERRVRELVQEVAPDLAVTCSSDVLPEYREYERTMTTVLNAYVMPVVGSYLSSIDRRLSAEAFDVDVQIVRSDAGIMSLQAAREHPVNTVLSGPAGGVNGAVHFAALAGHPSVVTFDMGGTSTDICLSTGGEPRLSTDMWVSDYPIRVPIIDITTIGAGGGSIARVTAAGALQVGPQSAGADPGPACYGGGGELPTVTDADAVLGWLPPELGGGEITLDVEAARRAVATHIGEPLGLGVEEAAAGIVRIVTERMLGALRVVSVQRGIDPRELVLVAFGGAGPVHGAELARLCGIETVLVPPAPGVLSALGFLLAERRNVFTLTRIGFAQALALDAYNEDLQRLVGDSTRWLEREGATPDEQEIVLSMDLRYRGQAYELPIEVPRRLTAEVMERVVERFHVEHRRRYGYDQRFNRVEVVNLRATAIGHLPKAEFRPQPDAGPDARDALVGSRRAHFGGRGHETAIYARERLRPGNRVLGPAVVEQSDCTTVLGPEQELVVDGYLNLVVRTNLEGRNS